MANHKSAEKRTRQNEKRRLRNRYVSTTMRGRVKELREAIDAGNGETAESLLGSSVKLISKAVGKGVLHKKQASRTISRLVKAVNKLK